MKITRKRYEVKDFDRWAEWQAITFFVGMAFLAITAATALIIVLTDLFGGPGLLASFAIISGIAVAVGLKGNVKRVE